MKTKTKLNKVNFVQLVVAPWGGDAGMTYSLFALGKDGLVYRHDPKCGGWLLLPAQAVNCWEDHKRKW